MKKNMLALAIAVLTLGSLNANAQDNNDREGRRAEMQTRQTERLIKDLKLTDEQKAKFDPIYANYQKELASLRPQRDQTEQADKKKMKNLTEAEATARLQEVFTRQEQQIQQAQQRLDIQKKYYKELSSVLTPQQLLRVFRPFQNRGGQQQSSRGNQGGHGNFGGPRGGGFGGPQGGMPGGGDF